MAASTYYGKTFIQVSQKASNNSLRWLFSQINEASLATNSHIHDVNPANVFDPDFKAPLLYNALASEYDQFSVGEDRLYFNHRARHEKVNPELLKLIERNGRVWCGWTKTTSPIVMDRQNKFYVVTKQGETELGSVYDYFKLPEEKAPIDFAEIRIFSKYVPVGVVLAYYLGLDALIALLNPEMRVVPPRKNKNLGPNEYPIVFKDQTLVFKTTDPKATLILAGFLDFEKITKLYDKAEFNHQAVYLNLLMAKKMSAVYVKELDMMEAAFIDPISAEVLAKMNEPTTFTGLIVRATELLQTYDHPLSQDRSAMRDRGYERFAGTIYRELMQQIRQYRTRNVSGRSKIEMSPYQVWNAIMKDNSLKVVEDINPIQNLKESEVITFAGTGGRDKDSMTKPTRAFVKSNVGDLSESSVDNSAVGTIAYLSANPQITDVRGLLKEKKELNPTSMLSTSALISPASMNDNPKRIMFICTQHSHTIASDAYRQPAVRTGYEFMVGKRTGKLFATTADEAGEVTERTERGIIVTYASGEQVGIELGRLYGKAEGTVYPHDVVSPLQVGDTFKKDDVLAYNTKFFEPDFLNPREIILKTNRTQRTLFREGNETHEDACTLSESAGQLFQTETTKIKSYVVDFAQNILEVKRPGEEVDPKDVLMIIEDVITATHGQFSEAHLHTLRRLANVAPRANLHGTVERIEIFYNGDKKDMSPTLKRLADRSDAEMAAAARASHRPVVNGRVTDEYRVKGTPLEQDKAEIRLYITTRAGTGTGDKVVFGHQMKCTVSEVKSGKLFTEDGKPVDATFSFRSVANRQVMSTAIVGTTTTILEEGLRQAIQLYDGEAL